MDKETINRQYVVNAYNDVKEAIGGDFGFFETGFNIGFEYATKHLTEQLSVSEEARNVLATDLYKYTAKVDMLEEQLAEKELEIKKLNNSNTILYDEAIKLKDKLAEKSGIISYYEKNEYVLREQLAEKEKELSEVKEALKQSCEKVIDYSSCLTLIQSEINNTLNPNN